MERSRTASVASIDSVISAVSSSLPESYSDVRVTDESDNAGWLLAVESSEARRRRLEPQMEHMTAEGARAALSVTLVPRPCVE